MINFKVLLSFAAVLCLAASADVLPPRWNPSINGVPRSMPLPNLVGAVQGTPKATEVPKPNFSLRLPQNPSVYPPQRVNLRSNYLPPGSTNPPYPTRMSVSTLPPPAVEPLREELSSEEPQLVPSTVFPQGKDVVIREIPSVSPVPEMPIIVTDSNPTTVLNSQSIVIKPRPTESSIEWASSQPTLDDLVPSGSFISESVPVPTKAPIIPIIKPRPKPDYKPTSSIIMPRPIMAKPVAEVKPVPRPRTSSGIVCAAANGYFPVGQDCDSYIECKKNIPTEYVCPDGLHFNPEALWPNYPCGYPSEVQCTGRISKNDPQPTQECPRQYGFFPMDNAECSKYIMCQEGKATIMNCPPGLAFSVAVNGCDWPENVLTCNPAVFQGFQCPAPPLDEDGKINDLIENYKYGDSCKNYVACQRGHPRLLSCDEGYSFDNISKRCIDSDYVKNCEL